MGGAVGTPDGCAAIQKDLKTYEKWADPMKFNKGKYQVLHISSNNFMHSIGFKERLWCREGQQADHEPAMCPGTQLDTAAEAAEADPALSRRGSVDDLHRPLLTSVIL